MIQVVASLTINPEEPQALQAYMDGAMALIEKAGGKVVQTINLGDAIVGDPPSELLMLVDYPSYDAVDYVFRSKAYRDIIPHRNKAFLKYNICLVSKIDGLGAPASIPA